MIKKIINEHILLSNTIFSEVINIKKIVTIIKQTLKKRGVIFWIGNGGSAADCQHLSAEFMIRFRKKRKPLKSISLTTDTSLITAHSNDFNFETVFTRQLEGLMTKKDLLIAISTSGESKNIVHACNFVKKKNFNVIAFLGNNGGRVGRLIKNKIVVKSQDTARVQEMHILIGHIICSIIDD
jgi:D-sedoheptulose 7-phosphate isomerase